MTQRANSLLAADPRLGALRDAGVDAPAVFVTDFAPHRLANLQSLYGRVAAVPVFDAQAIRAALTGAS